jgi:hypothetical protein
MMDWLTRGFLSLQNPGETTASAYGSTEAATAKLRRIVQVSALASLLAVVAATGLPELPHWFRAAMWIVDILAVLALFAGTVRWIRTWDELQQRIFISSAANAFVFTLFAMFVNVVLPKIGVPQLNDLILCLLALVAFATSWVVLRRSYE